MDQGVEMGKRRHRRFRLAERERYGQALPVDKAGKVRVYVRLVNPEDHTVVRGNVSRTFTVLDTKVTEVADAIQEVLSS